MHLIFFSYMLVLYKIKGYIFFLQGHLINLKIIFVIDFYVDAYL